LPKAAGREGGDIPDSAKNVARGAVIFDRYPLFLDVVARFLDARGIDVLGSTNSFDQALTLVEEHSPDLFVAGLNSDDGSQDGIRLVREAVTRCPQMKVIALANGNGIEQVEKAFSAGASAYVTSSASPEDIVVAIRQMFERSVHLAVDRRPAEAAPSQIEEDVGLTAREREILVLAAEGRSNAELAQLLWVTPQTVKFHLSNIYRKLNVSNRTQASRWAQLANLAPEPVEERELLKAL
jgi:DNA-binding NarL/FixJ family response regulator